MSGQPAILIAALSGRALAQSARRAGFVPYVVDAFGDDDMCAAAGGYEIQPSALTTGFTSRVLVPALNRLSKSAGAAPVGLVLGSGFDDRPRLVGRLARDYRVFGSNSAAFAAVKDPFKLRDALAPLGVPFPEMSRSMPADLNGWLSKRQGATGGGHVMAANAMRGRGHRWRYFQKLIDGVAMSVLLACNDRQVDVIGVSQQWCVGHGARPFRYAGAIPDIAQNTTSGTLTELTRVAANACGLSGLASFDYIVSEGQPYLLEVNPRPGATIDIFDDDAGTLFKLHMGTGGALADLNAATSLRAAALLYNDDEARIMPNLTWPNWAFDRTPAGQPLDPEQPIASVQAVGDTMDETQVLLAERLASLRALIYTSIKTNPQEKRHHAQVTSA